MLTPRDQLLASHQADRGGEAGRGGGRLDEDQVAAVDAVKDAHAQRHVADLGQPVKGRRVRIGHVGSISMTVSGCRSSPSIRPMPSNAPSLKTA